MSQPPARSNDLNAVVLAVADEHAVLAVYDHRMRGHELAGAMPDLAEARDPSPLRREPVDAGVAIAVGDIDLAVRSHGGARRMVERLGPARPVAYAELEDRLPAHVEDDDLMRVAVDDPDAVLRVDGKPMRIEDRALAIGPNKGAVRREDQHWRVAPPQHMDMGLRSRPQPGSRAPCAMPAGRRPKSRSTL